MPLSALVTLHAQDFTRDANGHLVGYAFPFSEVSEDSENPIHVDYTLESDGRVSAIGVRIPGLFLTLPENLGIVRGTGFSPDVLVVDALQPLDLQVEVAGDPVPEVTWDFGDFWTGSTTTGNLFSLDAVRYTHDNYPITVSVENEHGSESFNFVLSVDLGPYPEGLTTYDLDALTAELGWQIATADTPEGWDEAILLEEVPVNFGTYPIQLNTASDGVLSYWIKTVGDARLSNTVSSSLQDLSQWTLVEWELYASTNSVTLYPQTLSPDDAILLAGIQFQETDDRVGIDLLPSENGSVIVEGGGTLFPAGETIQLLPVPEEGYRFFAWTGSLSGTDVPYSLVLDYSRAVGALFVPDGPFGGLGDETLSFESGGDAPWVLQTDDMPPDSILAARSGVIGDNEQSWIETTVEGPGTLTFDRKIASSYGDYLDFYIGGDWEDGWTGGASWSSEAGWKAESFRVENSGPTTVRWVYEKNESGVYLADAGFLANVRFQRDPGRTFADWVALQGFPEGQREPDSINGAMGIPNLLRFAMGFDDEPILPHELPYISEIDRSAGIVRFWHLRRKELTNLDYTIQISVDLRDDWQEAEILGDNFDRWWWDGTSEWWEAEVIVPDSADAAFLRLRVTEEIPEN